MYIIYDVLGPAHFPLLFMIYWNKPVLKRRKKNLYMRFVEDLY